MNIATAYVELRVKSDKGKAEARDQARATAQEMTRTFAKYFSAKVVIQEFNRMKNAASDLQQAVGGTEAIFGKAGATIDRYAKTSAKSVGLSKRAFRELTSQIGGLLNGLGFTQEESAKTSVSLTQLGADLAATFGGKPEEAVQALGAALRGEFNPLERFGVSLRVSQINLKAVELGLAESTTQVDGNARAQAALALITEQTANAQGQFGREANTAAGKEARLTAQLEDQRAKIGKGLLPVWTAVLDLLGGATELFDQLPAPVQTAVVAMAGIAVISAPTKHAVEALGDLRSVLTKLPPTAIAVTAAIVVASVAYKRFTASSRELKQRTKEVSDALIGGREDLLQYAREAAATESKVDDLAIGMRTLSDALLTGEDGKKITQALGTLGLQAKDTADILIRLGEDPVAALTEMAIAAGLGADEAARLAGIVNGADHNMDVFAGTTRVFGQEMLTVAQAMEELQDQSEKVDFNQTFIEELNGIVSTGSDAERALLGIIVTMTGLSRSGENAGEVLFRYKSALPSIIDKIDATANATGGLTNEIDKETEALDEARGPLYDIVQLHSQLGDEFDQVEAAASALRTAIDKVFGSYLDVDEASDNLKENTAKLEEELKKNGATLDNNTDAGRRNRAQIRDQVEGIFSYVEATIAAGESTDAAKAKVDYLTEGLRGQMLQAGFTEEQVEDYLKTLGLTPENVTTAIELAQKDIAKREVEDYLTTLDGIPDEIESEIRALIDEGAYRVAKARLDALATARNTTYVPSAPGGGSVRYSASGRFVPGGSNLLTYVGERAGGSGDEVILPLGNQSRLLELLANPRVAGPVAGAMPGASAGGGQTLIQIYPRGDVEVADINRALAMARLQQ